MLTTRGSSCRGKLLAEDFEIVYDEHPSTLADSTAFSRETALHLWLAQHHQAGAIVQTHSIWSLLLADRYGPLEGIMLEGYDLLQRLPNLETKSPVEWLPIVSFYDQTPLIQAIERTMKDSPTELSRPPRAMVLQQQGLLTWAADINEAHRQAELFEYFCEYWVRKASLG